MKTLKQKLSLVYIFLVLIIGAVGITSGISLYMLGNSINGLINDNYLSINAVDHMKEALAGQNMALAGNVSSIAKGDYYSFGSTFYKWYNVEAGNITEAGESALVVALYNHYLKYQALLPGMNGAGAGHNSSGALKYYNSSVYPAYQALTADLQKITSINETAMFNRKTQVMGFAKWLMYGTLLVSLLAILIAFAVARFLTGRFLRPLDMLKENVKLVEEDHFKQEVPIVSNDEIGELSEEFNRMIVRLQRFENGTKGRLMEEKNRSLAIVKSISDPLIVLDMEYKMIMVNNACEMFFGVREQQSVGKHFLEIFARKDLFDHIVNCSKVSEDKHIPKIISIDRPDKNFYFDTIVTKVRNADREIIGFVVLFQNVTKLKKLEKAKTDFISMISHEFKTPLTSIMMGTSLIKKEGLGKLNEKQGEVVSAIEDDTERLSTLVNDLIQLSKIESDRALYNFEACSIFGIVENSLRAFEELAERMDIRLISEVEEKLPRVKADHEKVEWVINNLISNSIKHTNAGDTVHIGACVRGSVMQIEVKDTGAGIPEEYVHKVFERFAKIHTDNYEYKGTGLGLSIAKEIVEAHRGRIWCESHLDEGSIFTFELPLWDGERRNNEKSTGSR